MRSFAKRKPSRNGEITSSFIDTGKSCLSREFYHHKYVLTLFAKINLAKKIEFTVVNLLGSDYVHVDVGLIACMSRLRKFCQRESNSIVTLIFFFLVDEGREDSIPTKTGLSSARQRNAI